MNADTYKQFRKLNRRLDEIEALLIAAFAALTQQGEAMTAEFDVLSGEVERSVTVQESVVTLVSGLADQIQALKNDPAKLQALADKLRASDDATAAAVVANTPAPPAPAVPPVA